MLLAPHNNQNDIAVIIIQGGESESYLASRWKRLAASFSQKGLHRMPSIIQFLILAALILAWLFVRCAFIAFRGFLITGAVLGACAGEYWATHRYGFCQMPNIIYLLIPAAVILSCALIYLAATGLRRFLLFASILGVIVAAGWLITAIAPVAGVLLIVWFALRALRISTGGGSLFKAYVVHSAVPDVSVGEAYMASETDLI